MVYTSINLFHSKWQFINTPLRLNSTTWTVFMCYFFSTINKVEPSLKSRVCLGRKSHLFPLTKMGDKMLYSSPTELRKQSSECRPCLDHAGVKDVQRGCCYKRVPSCDYKSPSNRYDGTWIHIDVGWSYHLLKHFIATAWFMDWMEFMAVSHWCKIRVWDLTSA